jgi:hypothetical protein
MPVFSKQSDLSRKLSKPKKPSGLDTKRFPNTAKQTGSDFGGGGVNPATKTKTKTIPRQDPVSSVFHQIDSTRGGSSGGTGGGGGTTGGTGGSGIGYNPSIPTYESSGSYGDLVGGTSGNFAGQYTPIANAQGFYEHPDVMAAQILQSLGITDPGMIDQFSQLIANGGYQLQGVLQGSGNSADQTNFIADWINQMTTPGGAVPEFSDLVNMVLNNQNELTSGFVGESKDPNEVNNLILSLLQATTGNPYYNKAMRGTLEANQRDYLGGTFQSPQGGTAGGYANYLRGQGIPGFG